MIAHPLKTVFVHIPKTAGYSIEQVFLSYLGLDQNSRPALLLRERLEHESGPPRLAHLTAAEYETFGYLSQQQRSEYLFFTVVRNPWARVTSFYRYLKYDLDYSLNEFVQNQLEKEMRSQKYAWFLRPQAEFIYDDQDQLQVDKVCRFENLQSDFNELLDKVRLPRTELPVANASQTYLSDSSNKSSAPDTLNRASIEKIALLYRRDVELLKYEW